MNVKDFNIVEGTTHYINIDCFHEESKEMFYLKGYQAKFYLCEKGKDTVKEKDVFIADNTISVKIEPGETIGVKSYDYECRIYKERDIFHVVTGTIKILKPRVSVDCLIKEDL